MTALIISQIITLSLLLVAAGWTFYLYKQLTKLQQLNLARAEEAQLLRQILTDVATGEANVWIDEYGNTCAERGAYPEVLGYKH
jgi:hypothetical protein